MLMIEHSLEGENPDPDPPKHSFKLLTEWGSGLETIPLSDYETMMYRLENKERTVADLKKGKCRIL